MMLPSEAKNIVRMAILASLAFASPVFGQATPVQSGRTAETPSGQEGERITRENPVSETVRTLRMNTRLNTRQSTRLDQRIDRDLPASNDDENEASSSYRQRQMVKRGRLEKIVTRPSIQQD